MESTILTQILIATSILIATGVLLSIILVIAEKKILNYGTCLISVNGGERDLEVEGGSSLLSTLGDNDIYVPSACGGRGSCAYCKVKVITGAGPISPVEEPYLSEEEKEEGVRLSCQVKVRNDLAIEIPEELFKIKQFKGVLEHKKDLTHDIVELRINLIEPEMIDFKAGQYIQLESEPYKGRDSVMRAYSISSSPSDETSIELNIRLVPDGICTTWVFEYLEEGQEVVFSGPYGDFYLRDTDAPMIFIAGGSGMAPIHSIVHDMVENDIERETTYIFGALSQEDLFYVDELKKIEEENSWFTFIPALSDEPEDSDWDGERGLVTDVLRDRFDRIPEYEAYLCGSPGMIKACVKSLKELEIIQDNIFYDEFA